MQTLLLILTFIAAYSLAALGLFILAKIIFPAVDEFRHAKQFKSGKLENRIKLN